MPELPEVETIRRGLIKFCVHQKVVKIEILCDKSFVGPKELVEGHRIEGMRRFGKALIMDFDGGVSLMAHLRMTGQLIYREIKGDSSDENNLNGKFARKLAKSSFAGGHPSDSFFEKLPNKQTRVVITMGKGTLYFNDQRKFGFMKVLPTAEVEQDKFIASLAPEPWQIDPKELYQVFRRKKNSPIKAVILDQKVIAGIGNIYADEALFYAKIHPSRKAGDLSLAETRKLVEGACRAMEASIDSGGSTMATYVKADGTKGDYLENFAEVFKREGKSCNRCGAEIVKIRVAGRGTHICPCCQKLESKND